MINFTYIRPKEISSALKAGREKDAMFIAGGTNLVDLMKRGIASPEKLIDISNLPMRNISKNANGDILIGALALNSEIAGHELIKNDHPLLSMALYAGASPQLRNMATTGGNIMQRTRCSYFYDLSMPCNKRAPGTGCSAIGGYNRMHAIFGASESCIAVHPSDMCVALSALDASVLVTGAKKERRIPFTDFHRLPGNMPEKDNVLEKNELITAVEIPANRFNKNFHYLKIRDRSSYAFALVSVAAALEISGDTIINARLAMGGVAHKPWRMLEAESYLNGKTANEENFKAAATLAMKDAKAYGYNTFKLKMAPSAIVNALKLAAAK